MTDDREKDFIAELVGEFLDQKNSGQNPKIDEFLLRCPPESKDDFLQAVSFVNQVDNRAASQEETVVPQRIGDFEVLREIGRGGMGVVYEAKQVSIPRKVALKLIAPWVLKDDSLLGRMQREAQSIAKLRHPNIVTVFATGEEDHIRYLAMEFVPGKGLDEIRQEHALRGEAISITILLRWIASVARALQCAHEAGVIHRDVKPSNIRITPEGEAVLIDFGLARDVQALSAAVTGAFKGSPYYASPEQIEAARDGIGPQADIYSLGVTLYECVTNRVPFDGETTEQIFHRILNREPVSPRALNPLVSRDLETVILKAMEKESAKRYSSAQDFANDLEALLEIRPIQASPSGAVTRSMKWAKRNRGWAAALSIFIVASFLVSAVLFRQWGIEHTLENYRAADRIRQAIRTKTPLGAEDEKRLRMLLPDEASVLAFLRDPDSPELWELMRRNLEETRRGPMGIDLVGPRSRILSQTPVFRFHFQTPNSEERPWHLVLSREDGSEQSFPISIPKGYHKDFDFVLPESTRLELRQIYRWSLRAPNQPKDSIEKGAWVYFQIVNPFEYEKWTSLPSTGNIAMDRLLKATVLNAHGLAEESLKELELFPAEASESEQKFRSFLMAEAFAMLNDRKTIELFLMQAKK